MRILYRFFLTIHVCTAGLKLPLYESSFQDPILIHAMQNYCEFDIEIRKVRDHFKKIRGITAGNSK